MCADYFLDHLYSEVFEDCDRLRHDVKVAGRAHDDCNFHIFQGCMVVCMLVRSKVNQATNIEKVLQKLMLSKAYCHNKCARWSLLPTTEHTNHQQTQHMAHHRARSSHKTTTEHKKNSSSVSEEAVTVILPESLEQRNRLAEECRKLNQAV